MTIKDIREKGLLLFECISGSKAYGLATEKSDTDLKGVFYLPMEQFYGLDYIEQISNETNDEVYYELRRFVDLLIKNNPNILELLATPKQSVLYRHPVMCHLTIDMFLSKLCKDSFAGYALTQVRKARGLNKKLLNPVDKERKSLLDFCFVLEDQTSVPVKDWLASGGYTQEQCGLSSIPHAKGLYALFIDPGGTIRYHGIISNESVNDVSLSSIPKGEHSKCFLYFNKEGYSTYCKEYKEYWDWVNKRNEDRYLGNMEHGKGYDAKNMMHTIRLLQVAIEILRDGQLNVQRPNRQELLKIKSGAFEYEELVDIAESLMKQVDEAWIKSTLPDIPDRNSIESTLAIMRQELYHTSRS